jgi:hypothetical protein
MIRGDAEHQTHNLTVGTRSYDAFSCLIFNRIFLIRIEYRPKAEWRCTRAVRDLATAFRGLEMSALPPKADICDATSHVRFGPIADMHPD